MAATLEFGNLKSDVGLGKLEEHLKMRSYVTGFRATADDVLTFKKLLGKPTQNKYPSVCRWYRHIDQFEKQETEFWPTGVLSTGKAKPDNDDDFDVFGDETEEDKQTVKALSQKTKETKKKDKPAVINKSTLVIEVKPASAEVPIDSIEAEVRKISMKGLEWSQASKKVPVAFGLFKLQIGCTIIDDDVETDRIIETIETLGMTEGQAKEYIRRRDTGEEDEDEDEDEEYPGLVQSAEIVSFNKL